MARRRLQVCFDGDGIGLQWLNLRSENGGRVGLTEVVRNEIIKRAKLHLSGTIGVNDGIWLAKGCSRCDLPDRPWHIRW